MSLRQKTLIHYTILFVVVYLIIFLKLGSFHMRWWDESMFAVNTYEMLQNGNYFSLYFDQAPDLFNTKPPLTSWLQLFFVKLFGYNELVIRLPSALASAGTVIILFHFISTYFDKVKAWITSLILLTSFGFVGFHTARTGDSDAILCFFITAANLAFARFIISNQKKHIIVLFVFLFLAFATKLYAAFLFLPAYLFVLLYKKRLLSMIANWQFIVCTVVAITLGFLIIYLRVQETPSYLDLIISKDAGRLFTTVEFHTGPPLYYLDNFYYSRFSQWFTLAFLGGIIAVFSKQEKVRNVSLIFCAFLVSYLTIIMISVTKLAWYDLPLFPYLSFFAALPVYFVISKLQWDKKEVFVYQKYIIIGVLFLYPFIVVFNKSQANTIGHGEIQLESKSIYIFNKNKSGANLDGLKVLHNDWKGSLLFYQYKLAEQGQEIKITNSEKTLSVGDLVLVSEKEMIEALQTKFELEKVDQIHNAILFRIQTQP